MAESDLEPVPGVAMEKMDGWMDGWMDVCVCLHACVYIVARMGKITKVC